MTAISNSTAYDAWFRARVLQALEDTRPDIEDTEVDAYFAKRRTTALRTVPTEKR